MVVELLALRALLLLIGLGVTLFILSIKTMAPDVISEQSSI